MHKVRPEPVELTDMQPKLVPRLSLVVPTYNVAAYLDAFFESVFAQTSQTQRFEVIIVDDGSTDGSGQIALDWAEKYPNFIRCIRQENRGLSEARNTGLRAARGKWISFPDPDDFLDSDYFRTILEQIEIPHEKPLLMIVANLLPYDEATETSVDNHPLNYRFARGLQYVDTSDMGGFIHLSAASCWFERATLRRLKLRFNPRVQPVFEDGHLVTKLLMLSPDRTIAVVPKAIYNYRKRADASSLVMGAKSKKGFYLDTIEYGYLDLMLFAKAKLGHVPQFVQRVCLYELQSRIKYLMGDAARSAVLTAEEQDCFVMLLQRVFDDISVDTIQSFQIGRFQNHHRIAIIARFKPQEANSNLLYIEKYDPQTRSARFSYFSGVDQSEDVSLVSEGRELRLTGRSSNWTSLAGQRFLGQHWFHVRLPKSGEVSCTRGDTPLTVRHIKRNMEGPLIAAALENFLAPVVPTGLTEQQTELRAQIQEAPETYHGAWLLMDRPMQAGGDAAHLYQHLQKTGRAENVWFVLSVFSPDWARLMAAGFRLLPYGNKAHLTALCQGELLVTSVPDPEQHWPVKRELVADIAQIRTVVLPQEGMPPKAGVDYLCVPSSQTVKALTAADSSPRWFAYEVTATGFPRHDMLASRRPRAKTVLIAPDWLRDISQDSGENPLTQFPFKATDIAEYRAFWAQVMKDPALRDLKSEHKLNLHAVVGRKLGADPMLHSLAQKVVVFEPGDDPQIICDAVQRADLVVTDQPSVAFDAAYLTRQTLLCRQESGGIALPLPEQILQSESLADLVSQIGEHYRADAKTGQTYRPKDYFLRDSSCASERVVVALQKLAGREMKQ